MASAYLNPALIANSAPTPDYAQNSPINLAEGVAKVQQLQQQAAQQAALAPIAQQQAQATLQGTQLSNAQTQQNQENQKAFMQAVQQAGGDPDKLEQLALQYTQDPYTLARIQTMAGLQRDRNSKLTGQQQAQIGQTHIGYASQLDAAINETDPAKKAAIWSDVATKANAELNPLTKQPAFPQGQFDPNTLPSDAQLAQYKHVVDQQGKYDLQQSKDKEERAKAAKAAIDADNDRQMSEHQAIANSYPQVTNKDQHEAWLGDIAKKYPDVAGDYANLPFDPESTPKLVEQMAMTSAQRAIALYNDQRGQAAMANATRSRNFTDIVHRANDPSLSPAQHEAAQQEMRDYVAGRAAYGAPLAQIKQQNEQVKQVENDLNLKSKLEAEKQKNQALDQSYQSALRKAGVDQNTADQEALKTDVDDPTKPGKTINAGQAIAQMRAARAIAADQAAQQQQIEQRRGWGQYAPKQAPAPAAPGANPAAAPTTGAPVKKTFPRANLPGFAAANKMTPQQAEQQLRSQGYQLQ
jgi:hypothetical protein